MYLTAILAVFSSLICYTNQADLKLELASVVFRHGDRSPIGTFPTDKYKESDWPQGYGQLSILGMQHEEELGGLLKSRYVTDTYPSFLNSSYRRVQVSVRSTDVDRTLMSGASLLSALFPPDESERFNDTLAWQPIPIHTVAVENDHLLRGYNNCPAYSKLREADKSLPEYKQKEADNKEFFDMLVTETGKDAIDLTNLWEVEDVVYIENITAGKMSPSWATQAVITKLRELSDYSLSLMFNTPEKSRLSAGVWLDKVLGDMKSKANGTDALSKLFLYSAHDTTVACKLSALGLFDKKQPPYSTAFLVELFSDETGKYYVQFSLRKGPTSTTFDVLEQSFCSNPRMCTLAEFEQLVSPLIPGDIKQACGLTSSSSDYNLKVAFGLVTTFLLLGLVALIVAFVIIHKRSNKYTYDSFRDESKA